MFIQVQPLLKLDCYYCDSHYVTYRKAKRCHTFTLKMFLLNEPIVKPLSNISTQHAVLYQASPTFKSLSSRSKYSYLRALTPLSKPLSSENVNLFVRYHNLTLYLCCCIKFKGTNDWCIDFVSSITFIWSHELWDICLRCECGLKCKCFL